MKKQEKIIEKADALIAQGENDVAREKEDEKKLIEEIDKQFASAKQAQSDERMNRIFPWDDREDLFRQVYKHPDEKTTSIYSTGELSTVAIDGSCRVMAQLPSGRFYNSDGNRAKNTAMNLYFEEYVIPNAKTDRSLLIKFRIANMFSRVLPVIPMFVSWKAEKDGYIGPDPILIHPRRFYPQPGKVAIESMDYCFIDQEISKEEMKALGEYEHNGKKIYKNIEEILKNYKEDEGGGADTDELSPKERGKKKSGITIRNRFTRNGDWTIYVPLQDDKTKVILHKEGFYPCIPIALKGQYPWLDSLWDFNDFDRGQMSQKSIDSSVRMTMDAFGKMIKPPVMVDKKKVSLSTVIFQAGAVWHGERGGVEVQNINPSALDASREVYGMLKGNLLSMSAQQDTSVSKTVDSSMGKTPEAIRAQGSKQGARDDWDSTMQEEFVKRVYEIMAAEIDKLGGSENSFTIIGKSMQRIKERFPEEDLESFLDGEKAKINGEHLKGKWTYLQDKDSMGIKQDDTSETLLRFIEIYNKNPGIQEDFARNGQRFNQGEAFYRAFVDSGIQDPEKIIVKQEQPQSIAGIGPDASTEQGMQGVGQDVPVDPSMGVPVSPDVPQVESAMPTSLGLLTRNM